MKTKTNKKTSSELTVISPSALPVPPIVPKPTKSDVINAALERKRQLWEREVEKVNAEREEVELQAKQLCRQYLKDHADDIEVGIFFNGYNGKFSVRVSADVTSPEITRLVKKDSNLQMPYFNEKEERDQIKSALDNGPDRVKLILSNEENVKLIDNLLDQISLKENSAPRLS